MTTTGSDDRGERIRQAIRLKKAAARLRAPELVPRPADQPAYLGEMQRSLWLAHRLDPSSPAYNLGSAFRADAPVDAVKLQSAFNRIVARHRLLRSSFLVHRDTVLQVVRPQVPLAVEVLEVEDGEAVTAAIREARKPFDLGTGPLIRLRLIQEAREEIVLLVLHHILADERSLSLLWKEIAEAYDGGRSQGEPAIQYDDYVRWLGLRDRGERDRVLDYWRRRLEPMPAELRLPFESPAGEADQARGRLLGRNLALTLQEGIRRVAADTGATPFMVFAFAFRLLLHRYSGGQRVAFATPASTRSHPATAEMIGYFLNPVVVATQIDEQQGVGHAVRDFSRELMESLAHASLPFQSLVEELDPPRQRDRHPIFQTMFVYQEIGRPPNLGEARLEPVTLDLGASKFDLTLFVSEGESSLEIAVEFRADRFDAIWMERLLGHYEALLEGLAGELERPVAEAPTMGAAEARKLRADARGPELDTTEAAALPQQILDQVHRSPEAAAVSCGETRWSYRELASSARSIARELEATGVKPGDRVGLFIDRSALIIAGLLGSHWAGAAYVPLDPSYPEARNRELLEDAEVAAVLTTSELRDRLPAGAWPVLGVDAVQGDDAPPEALPHVEPDSSAYILYTSGSTGRPKGVVVSHDNLRASNGARLQFYGSPPKRFLLVPSVAFDSSVAGIFWMLATAGTLVIPTDDEARDPRRLAELVREQGVTSLLCVPSLYAQLLRAGGDRLRGLDSAIVAGESCPWRLVEEHFRLLPQVRLFNEYGPTEATVWATVHEFTDQSGAGPVPIGRPIPGVRIEVLDGLGRRVPAGIPGSAWISGPTVAQGYWRRPELSAERFVGGADTGSQERSYRTGDLMAWTPDGRLLFLGREDEQIKLRGFRIEPGEVEAALLESPEVAQAAVVARAAGSESTQLVAFVETAGDGAVTGWREELAKRLPEHMIPSRLVDLPELPRLPNGKIDRGRLRDLALEPVPPREREEAVPTTGEQALISLWEGLLGRVGIGPGDNFFELGGHSLLVVEMTLAIERDFEVSLTAADVFENPTVRELFRRIEQRGGSKSPPYEHLFPIQPGHRGIPFVVAVPHFFTETFAERFRGERPVYGLRGVSLRPEGNLGRWRSMIELGEQLVDEIQRRFTGQGCIMAGYSFGCSMAFEAVRIMEARGMPVHGLYLIAPMPIDHYRLGPLRLQLDGLRRPVDELSTSEALRLYLRANHPLSPRPYRRAWRWLAIEPWRRLLCGIGKLKRLVGLPLGPSILLADVRVDRFRLHAKYRPGKVHAPTVIFNARETDTDAAATWRPYCSGPFTVHETPDPHRGDGNVDAARQVILSHLSDLSHLSEVGDR